jgi:hypothetical protein
MTTCFPVSQQPESGPDILPNKAQTRVLTHRRIAALSILDGRHIY